VNCVFCHKVNYNKCGFDSSFLLLSTHSMIDNSRIEHNHNIHLTHVYTVLQPSSSTLHLVLKSQILQHTQVELTKEQSFELLFTRIYFFSIYIIYICNSSYLIHLFFPNYSLSFLHSDSYYFEHWNRSQCYPLFPHFLHILSYPAS
jgi:hypothetical protein